MNDHIDIEPILDDWFAEGSDVLPDRSVDAVLRIVRHTTQRGAWRIPWRTKPMNGFLRPAVVASAAIVVALAAGLLAWSGGQRPAVVGPPMPSATSSVSTAPASIDPRATLTGTITYRLQFGAASDRAYAMALPDGTPQLLSDTTCCLLPAPDQAWAMVASGTPVAPSIVTFGGNAVEGPWTMPDGLDLEPHAWSGRYDVAFDGWDDAHPDRTGVWLSVDNGGGMIAGTYVQLTHAPAGYHDVPLEFAPDGSKLLFAREANGNGDLYLVDVDRAALTTKAKPKLPTPVRLNPAATSVTVDEYFGPAGSWSPDGARITFAAFDPASGDHLASVYVTDAAGGSATAITAPGKWTTSAHWSHDGRWIAFDRGSDAGPHDLYVVSPDGGDPTELTADFAPGVCCSRWSPDSRYLLGIGAATDDAHADLYAYPIDGSTPIQLTHEPGQYLSYGWS